jgi:hypothetical protein
MNLPQDLINVLLGLAFSVGGWFVPRDLGGRA